MPKPTTHRPCKVCARIRLFVIAATPLILLIWSGVELDATAVKFLDVVTSLENITLAMAMIAIATALWKYWQEHKSRSKR